MEQLFNSKYTKEFLSSISKIDLSNLDNAVKILKKVQKVGGRLFILGVGGSAGNASHAVNDFRKLCSIESYCPTDNISEITARTNDEGFENIFLQYLKLSKLNSKDSILVLSVGGGNIKKKVSVNLISAIKFAKKTKSKIISIVGKKDGFAAKNSDCSIIINTDHCPEFVTPISETAQVFVWHLLVTHPSLKTHKTKW